MCSKRAANQLKIMIVSIIIPWYSRKGKWNSTSLIVMMMMIIMIAGVLNICNNQTRTQQKWLWWLSGFFFYPYLTCIQGRLWSACLFICSLGQNNCNTSNPEEGRALRGILMASHPSSSFFFVHPHPHRRPSLKSSPATHLATVTTTGHYTSLFTHICLTQPINFMGSHSFGIRHTHSASPHLTSSHFTPCSINSTFFYLYILPHHSSAHSSSLLHHLSFIHLTRQGADGYIRSVCLHFVFLTLYISV